MSQSRRYPGTLPAWPARWVTIGLLVFLLVGCAGPTTQATPAPSAPVSATATPADPAPAPALDPTATPAPPTTATRAATATVPPRLTATATATRRPTTIPTGPTATAVSLSNPSKLVQVALDGESIARLAVGGSTGGTLFSGGKGVFRSIDGGKTWKAVRSELDAPRVTALVVAPSNPQTVYVGVNNDCTKTAKHPGYVSLDGGDTWRAIGNNLLSLAVDPKNAQLVYATDCDGLKRSSNGGATWQVLAGETIPAGALVHIAIAPAEPQTLYLALSSEANKLTIARSSDRGETWKGITPKIAPGLKAGQVLVGAEGNTAAGRPQALAVDADNPAIVLLSTTYGVFRSEDSGAKWTLLDSGLENTAVEGTTTGTRLTSALVGDPDRGGMFWVGTGFDKLKGVGLYRTRDSGANWRKPIIGLEGKRINALVIGGPPAGRILYIATDDGIWSLTAP